MAGDDGSVTGKAAPKEARYAIFFAPTPETDLGRLGWAWLGRDPASGADAPRSSVDGLSSRRIESLTAVPRLYGFHATLKPPFRLAEGRTYSELTLAFDAFCARQSAFDAPTLQVGELGGFLALMPADCSAPLDRLAAACVREFDGFRARPTDGELDQLRDTGLSPRRDALLRRWGYPYVLEEFRFHMTLTGRLSERERNRVRPVLAALFSQVCDSLLPIDGICLFSQAPDGAPFLVDRRRSFGA